MTNIVQTYAFIKIFMIENKGKTKNILIIPSLRLSQNRGSLSFLCNVPHPENAIRLLLKALLIF